MSKSRKKTKNAKTPKNKPAFGGDPQTPPSRSRAPETIFGIPKSRLPLLIIFIVIVIGGSYFWIWVSNSLGIQKWTHEVVNTFPHDDKAFTQGLLYHDGFLYESTGKYGESDIRKVELSTGKVVKSYKLDQRQFGEGLALFDDKLYQLTWQEKTCNVYDLDLNPIKTFSYKGDGWGLTNDKENLIMSDGTPTIKFIDPETFEVVRKITVRRGRSPQYGLNELEYIHDRIYANDIKRSVIYVINPGTGAIEREIDFRELVPKDVKVDVFNGIAFNETTGFLLVTGKYWPHLYEVRPIPVTEKPAEQK